MQARRSAPKGLVASLLLLVAALPSSWPSPCAAAPAEAAPAVAAAEPVFPIKASADGRYFVDARNRPFLYHADTAWLSTKKLTAAEVDEYLDRRKAQGFTAIHVHAVSKEQGPAANRDGQEPFVPLDDISKPNEAYWRHVDHVLAAAERRKLLVALAALWIRWGGNDKDGWRYQLTGANAQGYARFLAKRYGKHKNLIWILGGDANPWDRTFAILEMGNALRTLVPHQLVTYHATAEFPSAAFFHNQPWHGVNLAYTYKETHRQVLGEYLRPAPVRPIVLGESGYEEESNDKRDGGPHRMRRQAWGALLSGALGGHAYGHRAIWRFAPDWRQALEAPGGKHMTIFKDVVSRLPWWKLVPDQDHDLLVEGYGAAGEVGFASAARAEDRSFALVYLPEARPIKVDLGRISGTKLEGAPFASAPRVLTPPAKNAAGERDFVLLLETTFKVARR
jgi:hypothetical protein